MEEKFLEKMEKILEENNCEIDVEELFFDTLDEFAEKEKVQDITIEKVIGKVKIIFRGHLEEGEEEEDDCVYIKDIDINGENIEVESYF